MRVAFVAEETAHHRQTDATERMQRPVELLAGRGHDVTVLCPRWWEDETEIHESAGVTYRAVTDQPDPPTWLFAANLVRDLRAGRPEVIHAVHSGPSVVYATKLAAVTLRVPLALEWYAVGRENGGTGYRNRVSSRLPDLVVVPSEMVRTVVRELGRGPTGLRIVPNSIDLGAIRAAEPESLADIVYSRDLDADANLESLLLALAELRGLDWRAVVIGDGPARRGYEDQAVDLRIEDRVEFLGAQPTARRLSLFKGAHAYVHTARRTSFPTDLLRAMACGCVGIAEYHAESSAHELVAHRDRGIRITGDDELADALHRAAELPQLPLDDGFEDFDQTAILEEYLECYRSLMADYDLL